MKSNRDFWIANEILKGRYRGFYQLKMYALDSFSAFQIEYGGETFPTAEHLYQALKFEGTNYELFEEIRCTKSPQDAKTIAHFSQNLQYVRADWDNVKADIMRHVCLLKLSQHPYIQEKLIESGDFPLAELSMSDYYWGIGEDGSGKNMLGLIWEELRCMLKNGVLPPTPKS